jgi:hypothetical protein
MKHFRPRLSASLVVSLLALFVALGGWASWKEKKMSRTRKHPQRTYGLCSLFVVLSLLTAAALAVQPQSAAADEGFPGTSDACAIDKVELDAELSAFIGPILSTIPDIFINGLGVAWVDPSQPMQSETGVVREKSDYSTNDLPWDHDTHDMAFDVRPDASSRFLMSDANIDDKGGLIENEWEYGDFPQWAWPNLRDRAWVNGNWVLDCNHEEGISEHYDAEIHPMRAIATMRQQTHTLPGSGTTPVAVTGTDLYIHGDGGYATTVLECGVNVVLITGKISNCTTRPGIAEDFDFEIPLGAPPFPGAVPAYSVESGPGNTLSQAATLTYESTSTLDGAPAYQVHVPLVGSGATNHDVYARKIYTGWVAPPANLHHYVLTLVKGHMKNDIDPIPFDGCDCSQFFMSVNQATDDEWSSLVGYDVPTDISDNPLCPGDDTLDGWSDGSPCGNGDLNFTGPSFDFYTHDDVPISVHFKGVDSDCADGTYGSPHTFEVNGVEFALCFLSPSSLLGDGPQDDSLGTANETFFPFNVVGDHVVENDNYAMRIHADEIPLGLEDTADLGVTKSCAPAQVTAPAPFTCRIEVTNAGPALPHDVKVTNTITAPTTNYTILDPKLTWENVAGSPPSVPCTATGNQIACDVDTVPLGGAKGVITYDVTSTDGGTFTDTATVTTGSTDNNSTNDTANASAKVVVPTRTAIASSADPSRIGQTVTYTATVTAAVGTSTPTGTVTFFDYDAAVGGCAGVALVGGQGVCTVTYAAAGNHHMTVVYSGSTNFLPSTSPPLGQTVTKCTKLQGCNLAGADLTNAPLAGVNLKGANLKNALLVGTNFTGAILAGANLSRANLTGAKLTGTDLTGANLLGANLTSADLTGALTTGANFNHVLWSDTTCPDGTNSTTDGGTCIGHL